MRTYYDVLYKTGDHEDQKTERYMRNFPIAGPKERVNQFLEDAEEKLHMYDAIGLNQDCMQCKMHRVCAMLVA